MKYKWCIIADYRDSKITSTIFRATVKSRKMYAKIITKTHVYLKV